MYSEMKKQMPNLGVSLSLIEISYNETEKSENILDLLDVSCKNLPMLKFILKALKDDYGVSLDFTSYCNVAVRSQHELEKVLKVGLKRSSNWEEKKK